jgi:PilZ domain
VRAVEKKRNSRKNCRVFLEVSDADTGQLVGHLVNITTDGLMVTSEKPLEIDNDFHLKILFPQEIKGVQEFVTNGTSVWCEEDEETPSFFNTGFQLKDVARKDIKVIKKMIKKYCF